MLKSMFKVCYICREEKNSDCFSRSSTTIDGFRKDCKSCASRYYHANKEKYKQKHKEYYEANKEKAIKDSYAYRKLKPEKRALSNRKNHLKREYGLSWDEFVTLYDSQEGKCRICGCFIELQSTKNSKTSACVDHCHETSEVRGLLCRACNVGIGNLKDSTDLLAKAIVYLESFKRSDD